MEWVYDDGGRKAAGYSGSVGDCCCRAFAIVTGKSYDDIYSLINECAKGERRGTRKRSISSAREGVYTQCARKVADRLGLAWTPTMKIGSGCKVHLRADELPDGRIVCCVSGHYVAVIDGVIHDTFNSSVRKFVDEFGNEQVTVDMRCVYGYWKGEVHK